MGRREGAIKAHTKKAKDTKIKVKKVIEGLKFLQYSINIATVSRQAKVCRVTAKKYMIELGYIKKV
jgi:response regulator of citrate/malate metabolism